MDDVMLVTGATGFLGGALVVDAIRRGLASRLLLLVRADDPRLGWARLTGNLRLLGASDAELAQLGWQQVLFADLNALTQVADDARLAQVTVVIHCAALATFSEHPGLEKVNVDGTFELAALVHGRPRLRRFLYVGTAMACGRRADPQYGIAEAMVLPLAPDSHLVPYTRSKALAESMLRKRFPSLPLVVARPSIIVGHTVLGCAPSQSIFWVFQVWQALRVLTAKLDDRIDVVPVDWCAAALLHLALKPALAHAVYHLSAGESGSRSFRQIGRALAAADVSDAGRRDADIEYEYISVDEIRLLIPCIRSRIPDCNPRLLVRALSLYGEFARLAYVFHNQHLQDEGMSLAPPLTDYIEACAASTRHISISSQMKWDFK